MALRAAEMDAYRKLLEVVKGVQVTSYINVEGMISESSSVRTKTMGMLRGMQLVEVTYSNDGSCTAAVEVNIDKEGKFLLTAINNGEIKVIDDYPKFNWLMVRKKEESDNENIQSQYSHPHQDTNQKPARRESPLKDASTLNSQLKDESVPAVNDPGVSKQPVQIFTSSTKKNYTGLLVDARRLDLRPALAPCILNEKKEKIYGIGVMPTKVQGGAIVDYLPGNIETAKKYKKISARPLVVKGIKNVNKSDIMISNDDALKLVFIRKHLEQKKVVILH
jgi:hypothetical protein